MRALTLLLRSPRMPELQWLLRGPPRTLEPPRSPRIHQSRWLSLPRRRRQTHQTHRMRRLWRLMLLQTHRIRRRWWRLMLLQTHQIRRRWWRLMPQSRRPSQSQTQSRKLMMARSYQIMVR